MLICEEIDIQAAHGLGRRGADEFVDGVSDHCAVTDQIRF